jgi:DNA ligase D-like protein (predicted ligase)/DNA ligase D-like protein (predicted polymerase)/DNA ligase D-like protein (predicted 3'-phosphoesterase)
VEYPKPLPVEQRGEHWWMECDGRELRLSNLPKVFWPVEGYTKGDLIAYYYNIAPTLLPYLAGRPLTMKRMPNGIAQSFFYEKDAPVHTPDWMPRCPVQSSDSDRWGRAKHDVINYLMVENTAGLLFMANLGCVEFHPLHSRCSSYELPDYLFFDLDPFEPAAYPEVLAVAGLVRVACERLGLTAYPKTSGATGMQIYVPITGGYDHDDARALVGAVGAMIRRADPERVTMEWEVRKRTGKVFIDHNMNRSGANIAAVYSLRPEPGGTVSTPVTWDEVEEGDIRATDFTIRTVWDRLAQVGDLFRGVLDQPQDPGPAFEALGLTPPSRSRGRETEPAMVGARSQKEESASSPRKGRRATRPADDGASGPDAEEASAPKRGRALSKKGQEVADRSKDPKLGQYLSMRDFEETPEPAGGTPSTDGNSFVIQRHDATRLHYDLRLERDGVLVSWAVPKGLPLVKGVRHLAVQTEDHPMEYGGFEGDIPKGHYGAGVVRVWDHGTYDLVEWTDKKVSFRLHGERHHGEYHLVKTRGERDWLVLMASASEEEPLARPPAFAPMLAVGGGKPFDRAGWWFEPKLDGIRTLAYLEGETVRLVSRTGRDQTTSYPELGSIWRRVEATNAVIDGEIVATDDQGRTSFERLQQRMNLVSEADVKRMVKMIPVELVAFDLLWLDGQDLTGRPLSERRTRLTDVVAEGRGLRLVYWAEEHGHTFFEAATKLGLEGVVAKKAASHYSPGRRSDDWKKIKILKRQDCVIIGWTPGQGGRGQAFGALLLGIYTKDGRFIWTGQVGTGFTDRVLGDLVKKLAELETDTPPVDDPELRRVKGAHWVRPELVCEVEYLQITSAGKLRAPSFKGLRPDKLPEDASLES